MTYGLCGKDDNVTKKRLVTALKIAVTLILLGLILPQINWQTFTTSWKSYHGLFLLLLLAVALLDRCLMAYKWNLLLRSQGVRLAWLACLRLYIIGNFLSSSLPAGVAGEFYRVSKLASRAQAMPQGAASVLMERVLGALALAVFALLSLLLMVIWKQGFLVGLVVPVACFLLAVAGGFYLSMHFQPRSLVARFLPRYQEGAIVQKLCEVHDAYAAYRGQHRILWIFFGLSLLEQFLQFGLVYLAVLTLRIHIDPIYILGISPICHILELIPISISSIGVTEGFYFFFLSQVGVSATQVLSFTLLLRAVGLLVLMMGGVLYLLESLHSRAPARMTVQAPEESLRIATEHFYWKPMQAYFRCIELEEYANAGVHFAHPAMDLGCGDGVFQSALQARGVVESVEVSCDYVFKSLQDARQHRAHDVVQADIRALPMKSNSIASVFANGVLSAVRTDIDRAFSEVYRLLYDGGLFVLTVPSPSFDQNLVIPKLLEKMHASRLAAQYLSRFRRRLGHYYVFDEQGWKKKLEEAHFHVEQVRYYFTPRQAHWWELFSLRIFRVFALLKFISLPRVTRWVSHQLEQRLQPIVVQDPLLTPQPSQAGYLLIVARKR